MGFIRVRRHLRKTQKKVVPVKAHLRRSPARKKRSLPPIKRLEDIFPDSPDAWDPRRAFNEIKQIETFYASKLKPDFVRERAKDYFEFVTKREPYPDELGPIAENLAWAASEWKKDPHPITGRPVYEDKHLTDQYDFYMKNPEKMESEIPQIFRDLVRGANDPVMNMKRAVTSKIAEQILQWNGLKTKRLDPWRVQFEGEYKRTPLDQRIRDTLQSVISRLKDSTLVKGKFLNRRVRDLKDPSTYRNLFEPLLARSLLDGWDSLSELFYELIGEIPEFAKFIRNARMLGIHLHPSQEIFLPTLAKNLDPDTFSQELAAHGVTGFIKEVARVMNFEFGDLQVGIDDFELSLDDVFKTPVSRIISIIREGLNWDQGRLEDAAGVLFNQNFWDLMDAGLNMMGKDDKFVRRVSKNFSNLLVDKKRLNRNLKRLAPILRKFEKGERISVDEFLGLIHEGLHKYAKRLLPEEAAEGSMNPDNIPRAARDLLWISTVFDEQKLTRIFSRTANSIKANLHREGKALSEMATDLRIEGIHSTHPADILRMSPGGELRSCQSIDPERLSAEHFRVHQVLTRDPYASVVLDKGPDGSLRGRVSLHVSPSEMRFYHVEDGKVYGNSLNLKALVSNRQLVMVDPITPEESELYGVV